MGLGGLYQNGLITVCSVMSKYLLGTLFFFCLVSSDLYQCGPLCSDVEDSCYCNPQCNPSLF